MKHRYLAIAAAVALSGVAIGTAQANPPAGEITYGIFRNGDRIGTQRVRFQSTGSRVMVEHNVEIRVRVLNLEVFHYNLQARETWEGDRLLGMSSTTNRNGTPLQVFARAGNEGIRVRRANGERATVPPGAIPADPHWNEPAQGSTHMIEAEDGAVRRVRVSAPRQETIEVAGRNVRARRYDVTGEHTATLWYDASGVLVKKVIVATDGSRVVTVRLR